METCYRHPDRETGVSCSNCGRPICPDCMTSTSVGMRCPECSRETTKVVTAAGLQAGLTATIALIGLNVVVFLLGQVTPGRPLIQLGGVDVPDVANGEFWRLVTSGFLHFDLLHLLLNMVGLWILGSILERGIGSARFALIYFVALLGGSLGALIMNPFALTAGASGAIFGLMGAAFMILRQRGFSLMENGLGGWIAINLVITFAFSGTISVGGHIGGLITGGIAGFILAEVGEKQRNMGFASGLIAALGVVAVAGCILVA
ncbi:MAG: hypothetical protein QOG62_1788 [Thermoleophilaceae bacterium]|jgi:membrane associated rhomboid family serine protease|nr:hypothetical protein [Thermoleophilaceae bacterium]